MKYRVWGKNFNTARDISKDPRCEVPYGTLLTLIRWGIPARRAVAYPPPPDKYCIWGKGFYTVKAIAEDPRCQISYGILLRRL
jgi:hypothetical protein